MNILHKGCLEASKNMEKMDKLDPSDVNKRLDIQMTLFRSEFSVSISQRFLFEIMKSLENFVEFMKEDMTNDNLLEQYEFYFLTCLLEKTFQTFERLEIPVNQILPNKDDLDKLLKVIEATIEFIGDSGKSAIKIVDSSNEEISDLWEECENRCKAIQFLLLNVASESSNELISKIDDTMRALKTDEAKASVEVFLKYLTLPETLNRLCSGDSKDVIVKLIDIFDVLSERKVKKIKDHLSKLAKYNQL
jgi:hypothetical protein